MGKSGVMTHQGWCYEHARLVRWLKARWPQNTAKAAARDIGAPFRTVQNWLAGTSTPSAIWIIRLIAAYGPEFLAAIMTDPPSWIDQAKIAQERAVLARQMAVLEAQTRELEARIGAPARACCEA